MGRASGAEVAAVRSRNQGGLSGAGCGTSACCRWAQMALVTSGKGEQAFDQRIVLINRTAKEKR